MLLKQEHPDLEFNVPLAWNRRRRLEREKAAAILAGSSSTSSTGCRPPGPGRTEPAHPVPGPRVHGVEGVVRVEGRLTADVDDRDADTALAHPRVRA